MKIDWFTVIAQVINFLILVWLLKRFLYQPVLRSIDEREKKIANQLKEAEDREAAAEQAKTLMQEKLNAFERQRPNELNKVVEEAKVLRQSQFEQVRADSAAEREVLQSALREESIKAEKMLGRRIHQEVYAITEKAFSDLASAPMEVYLVKGFID